MNKNSVLLIVIAVLMVVLIIISLCGRRRKRREYMTDENSALLEVISNTDLEAFKNLSSMFMNGKAIVPDLEVTGDLVVDGTVTGDLNVSGEVISTGGVVSPFFKLDGTNMDSVPTDDGIFYKYDNDPYIGSSGKIHMKAGTGSTYFSGTSFFVDNLNTSNIYNNGTSPINLKDNLHGDDKIIRANQFNVYGTISSDPTINSGTNIRGAIFGLEKGIAIKGGGSNYSSSNTSGTNNIFFANSGTGDYTFQNGHSIHYGNDLGSWNGLF